MEKFHFGSITFLTSYHFFLTFFVLEIMCRMKLFERVTHIPAWDKWSMAGFGVGAVVFMNFNLRLNSVGFYQLSKLSVIPFIVLYNYIFEHKRTDFQTIISLTILLIGMTLFSVNDVQFNVLGSIIAAIGVTCVGVFQTKTGSKQTQYSISGPALQHATAVPQFVIALICAICFETSGPISIFNHRFNLGEIIMLTITGFFAASVNICSFGLIGRTSAITYQVVGHVKTILIFIFGLIMFPVSSETNEQFFKKILGLIISMAGMIYYSILGLQKQNAAKTPDSLQNISNNDHDSDLEFHQIDDKDLDKLENVQIENLSDK